MKTIPSILILGFAVLSARADSAEVDAQFFHPAASHYIQGDSTTASNLVAKGLSLHPDDGKLKRLKELLDKQQEQEQNQDNKNQDKQDKDQQQEQNQDQQQNQQQDNPDQQQGQNQQDQPEPQSAEQMSRDEASQLMDAMKQEEQNKRLELHPVMGAPVKVEKDW